MRRLRLLLLLLLMQPGQAFAHAALLDADPADGSTLAAAPGPVRLRFDEPVGLIALSLAGPDGAVAPQEPARVDGNVLTARFPPDLPRGTYLLSWRVTSVDSHPVFGTVAFGVGAAPDAAATAAAPAERWLLPSLVLRWLFLLALLVGAGGAMFRLVAPVPGRVATGVRVVAAVGVALAVLQVGLRGALLADAPTLLAAAPWALGAGTTLAFSLLLSAVGLAGCAATRGARSGTWFGVLALAGLPLSGHAGTADPRWLTAPALLLHGVAAAFWVGAFWPLLGVLRGADPVGAVRRFGRRAVPAVAVLLLSGTALASVQLERWGALTGSAYGRLLLLKLGLAAALMALAAGNRLFLTPLLAAGRPGPLRWSIRGEVVAAASVLAVTAVLGLTPPPRAEAAAARPPGLALWTQADGIGALVEVTPARAGRNEVAVSIDRAVPPREVWLELRQPGAGVAAIRRPMRLVDGRWLQAGPEMALPGRWTVRAEALLTEYDQTTFSTEIDIP